MESFWIIIRKYYHMNPELLLFLLLIYVSVFFVYIVKFIDFQSKSVSMSRLNRVSGMVTILNEWFILCRWTMLSPELFLLLKWNDWILKFWSPLCCNICSSRRLRGENLLSGCMSSCKLSVYLNRIDFKNNWYLMLF